MLLFIIDQEIPNNYAGADMKQYYNDTLFFIKDGILLPLSIRTLNRYIELNEQRISEQTKVFQEAYEECLKLIDDQIEIENRISLLDKAIEKKVFVILNSPGGFGVALNLVKTIINYFKVLNCPIISYSFIDVSSAAAMIFSETTLRYSLKLTKFMIHPGDIIQEAENDDDSAQEDDETNQSDIDSEEDYTEDVSDDVSRAIYEPILNDFFRGADMKHFDRIVEIKEELLRNIEECNILASELENVGLIDKTFDQFDDLLALLVKETHIEINKNERLMALFDQLRDEYENIKKSRV